MSYSNWHSGQHEEAQCGPCLEAIAQCLSDALQRSLPESWTRGGSSRADYHARDGRSIDTWSIRDEEEFCRRIDLIGEVPLFKRLPKAMYPLLADRLQVRKWAEGTTVVEAGEQLAEFFLVAGGRAEVQLCIDGEIVRNTLRPGDYFGEKMLEHDQERASPATIVATVGLVTWSITSSVFEGLGLRQHLRFPRRAAIGRTPQEQVGKNNARAVEKTEKERDFIAAAVRGNRNLRSMVDLRPETVRQMVDAAEKQVVKPGATVVRQGEQGGMFYIVESGSFELRLNENEEPGVMTPLHRGSTPMASASGGPSSAETFVSEMRRRMQRKQSFLQQLLHEEDLYGLDDLVSQRDSGDLTSTSYVSRQAAAHPITMVRHTSYQDERDDFGDSPGDTPIRCHSTACVLPPTPRAAHSLPDADKVAELPVRNCGNGNATGSSSRLSSFGMPMMAGPEASGSRSSLAVSVPSTIPEDPSGHCVPSPQKAAGAAAARSAVASGVESDGASGSSTGDGDPSSASNSLSMFPVQQDMSKDDGKVHGDGASNSTTTPPEPESRPNRTPELSCPASSGCQSASESSQSLVLSPPQSPSCAKTPMYLPLPPLPTGRIERNDRVVDRMVRRRTEPRKSALAKPRSIETSQPSPSHKGGGSVGKTHTDKQLRRTPTGGRVTPRRETSRQETESLWQRARLNQTLPLGFLRRAGDSFGELALLYNIPRTSTAVALEDSVVWGVSQAAFRRIMKNKEEERHQNIVEVLSRMDLFEGLLSSEKLELAQNFLVETFHPGDLIVRQGEKQHLWYILMRGKCSMFRTVDGVDEKLATLRPPAHFGERALLKDSPSEFSIQVKADQKEVRCLVLDGPSFGNVVGMLRSDNAFQMALEDDLLEFAKYKGGGAENGLLPRLLQAKMMSNWRGKVGDVVKDTDEDTPMRVLSNDSGFCHLDPMVPLDKRALDRVGTLGQGSHGIVTLERDRDSGQMFALKTCSKGLISHYKLQEAVRNERMLLTMVDSPFAIKLLATFKDANYVYFLFEPSLAGDLHIHNHRRPTSFRTPLVHRFMIGCVLLALEHLHERFIIYRDLKPENVLLSSNGYPKVCDFGFAKFCIGRTMTLCGTPQYVAPEVISQTGYDRMVDWWALGVLAFELMSGMTPFGGDDENAPPMVIFCNVKAGIDEVEFPFSGPVAPFVKALCRKSPARRLGIGGPNEVKQHEYFAETNFEALSSMQEQAPYQPDLASPQDMSLFEREDEAPPPFMEYVDDGSNWDEDF
eukprot:TRINITY_DN5284_c0_g1_i1.p1 TRINITY_DN5284_c0_g1~~TRINITY_DN5284_c0_g1_i1.p1  ORF type:complete len:1258 (+),score=300.04 TRINITY_DN5284_c0_g1_i1:68-3841(+)